jgi:hypothetical protein
MIVFFVAAAMLFFVCVVVCSIVIVMNKKSKPKNPKKPSTPPGNMKSVQINSNTLKKNTSPWHVLGFGGDEKTMSVSGSKIVYNLKKNTSGGQSGGMFKANPHKLFPATEVKLRYDVTLADSFPLTPDKGKALSGKLWGFCLGKSSKDCATGGNYNSSQGSIRVTFNAEKNLVATGYVYPTASSSNAAWNPQGSVYKKLGHATNKGHKLFLNKGNQLPLKRGSNTVDVYVKLNTPGKSDGIFRLTVNGKTTEVTDAVFRNDASVKLVSLNGNVFLGGSGKMYELDYETSISISNVYIQKIN